MAVASTPAQRAEKSACFTLALWAAALTFCSHSVICDSIHFNMFTLWKLRRYRTRLDKKFEKHLAKARKNHEPHEEIQRLQFDFIEAGQEADVAIESFLSDKLLHKAMKLDARLPASDDSTFWVMADQMHRGYLNTTGRNLVRDRISEARKRNFDDRSRWISFVSGIVGIIGGLIGILALLRHKS